MAPLHTQLGLNGLNFFAGAVQTAFGAFFTVYLTTMGWSQVDIGFVLSVGTATALIFQLPAGMLVDAIHFKRFAIALALVALGVSALMVVVDPTQPSILAARVLHSFASCLLAPAVAALTLQFCGHEGFGEQLGVNGRYASLGTAFAAAMLGAVAHFSTEAAVFVFTAFLTVPALLTLTAFRAADHVVNEHAATHHPRDRRRRAYRPWHVLREPGLKLFAVCVALFYFANAAMLPLALNEMAKRTGQSGFVVSAAIVVPQAVVALCSPWAGRLAESLGRRPVLIVGFAALPLRGLLFAASPDSYLLVAFQLLDGISGTVFGLAMPLVAADVTHRTGYLNLTMGLFLLSAGLGATASTTAAGWMADNLGAPVAFLALAIVGGAALTLIWWLMPETRPQPRRSRRRAALAV
jgi:MFS family permease